MQTVWVFGDQLNRDISSLHDASPDNTRILFIRSSKKIAAKRWHRQRLHLVLTSMTRFANELREEGFDVDEREAHSFESGFRSHVRDHRPDAVVAMDPLSWDGHGLLDKLEVVRVRSNQMLCHYDEFSQWLDDGGKLLMENFYRWQRKRLDVLMDGDEPAGGRWNFDDENREPPPKGDHAWPNVLTDHLDAIDDEIITSLPDSSFGAEPTGIWATSRAGALRRLRHFTQHVLPTFGPHEDAMLSNEFRLAHSMLSHALNIGLLLPTEVVDAAERAYRNGKVPIASAEGFIRQIIGWREYIWNVYWHHMPGYRDDNALRAKRALPPMFTTGSTEMNCMSQTLASVEQNAYAHHIQRLMVLGNFSLTSGIRPGDVVEWMHASFIDGAEWVMLPNVTGMALYADGGRMSTKPYASGGAYIDKMSDYCKPCKYNPKKRVGDDACPFTTLYWDFLDRHRERFSQNHRMSQQVRGIDRLKDMDEVRVRAREVLKLLDNGTL